MTASEAKAVTDKPSVREPEVGPAATLGRAAGAPAREDRAPSLAAVVGRAQRAPRGLTTADVLRLQRAIGNQATGALLARTRPAPLERVASPPRPVAATGAPTTVTVQRHLDEYLPRHFVKHFKEIYQRLKRKEGVTDDALRHLWETYDNLNASGKSDQKVVEYYQQMLKHRTLARPAPKEPVSSKYSMYTIGAHILEEQKRGEEQQKKTEEEEKKAKEQARKNAYDEALATHDADRTALKMAIDEAAMVDRATDRRLANAAEWVQAGKTKLYALTPTADSADRMKLATGFASGLALFPNPRDGEGGDVYSAATAYNYQDLTNNHNVYLDKGGDTTGGWNLPGIVVVYRAQSTPKAAIWETLRHEVQHDADQHRDKEKAAPNAREQDFEAYKTEYRAYNYQGGDYQRLSHTKKVTKYGWEWTERQLAIFEHIWHGYEHTQRFWDDSWGGAVPSTRGAPDYHQLDDKGKAVIEERQRRLVAYVNPDTEGFNKWNSVRVDTFYKALKAVPDGTTSATAARSALGAAIGALSKEDATSILEESPDFTRMMETKLKGEALTAVTEDLKGVT